MLIQMQLILTTDTWIERPTASKAIEIQDLVKRLNWSGVKVT